jgi:curved DNA-binding protein CbpA
MLTFSESLVVSPNASPETVKELLHQFRRKWEQKEAKGDPAVQEKARRMLDLVSEARKVLLDPAMRTEFDRKLGLRGEEQFTPASPKSRPQSDPRLVSDDQMAHIEEMKRRRKAEKADQGKT